MKRRILLSASLFHAINDAATVVAPMVFPILYARHSLVTSYTQIGILSNLGILATFVVQFTVVNWSFRHEYRRMMVVSLAGICLGLALMPFSRSFGAILAAFLAIRVFSSFYHPVMISWVSRVHPAEGLDTAMGIQSGSGNVGVLLGFVSVGYMAQRWGWSTPLFIWAVAGLLIGGLSCGALRGISSRIAERPRLDARTWWASLRGIKAYIPGFIFGGMGWSVAIYYAPSLLNHRFDVPIGRTGLYLALWIGLGTVSGYGYGTLSRIFGRKAVFLTSIFASTAALALIGFARTRTAAVAGILAYGAFLLMTYPSMHTFVGSTVAESGQTLAFSWVSNIQMVAGAIVSLAAGFLSDRFGIRAPFLLAGAISLLTFLYYAFPGAAALKAGEPARLASGAAMD